VPGDQQQPTSMTKLSGKELTIRMRKLTKKSIGYTRIYNVLLKKPLLLKKLYGRKRNNNVP
jgi:hypothetical protein